MSTIAFPSSPEVTADSSEHCLTFDDVHLAFEENVILDGVSFSLRRAETKILLGIAGSGKSTIPKLALGLIKPDRCRNVVLGEEVPSMPESQLFASGPPRRKV